MSGLLALARRWASALSTPGRALAVALGLGLLSPLGASAQDVLPIPALSGRVIDQTSTLSAAQKQALDAKLATLERETGSQVVVLMVPTTQPEDISSYAQRVGDQWKIGRRAVGDGVLIISAQGDRKIRIEVAKTLEGAIPDLAAKRIINEQITPAFKAGDFAGGLNRAVDQLAQRIRSEALPAPSGAATKGADGGPDWGQLAMFFFIGVPVVGAMLTAMFGRKIGSLLTGGAAGGIGWCLSASVLLASAAGVLALVLVGILGVGAARSAAGDRRGVGAGVGAGPIIWGGGGGGSSSSSSDSSGGFSSGGGGDFGGGGASGDW